MLAKAGIQAIFLDSRFRGNDDRPASSSFIVAAPVMGGSGNVYPHRIDHLSQTHPPHDL